MIGTQYVVAALVAIALLVGAHELGYHRADKAGKANLAAFQAEAKAEAESHKAAVAKVETKVVVQWRDRVKVIREPGSVREIEIIRKSGCVLPPEFRLLHDSATGEQAPEAGSSADPASPVDCATAAETVRENYLRARENAEQLKALQEWAVAASAP